MPRLSVWLNSACITMRSLMVILRRKSIMIRVVMHIKPTPPNCMRIRSTACPNAPKYVAVSPTTTSPVVETALVAVNIASKKFIHSPLLELTGRQSTNAPASITKKNPSTILCAGLSRNFLFRPNNLRCRSVSVIYFAFMFSVKQQAGRACRNAFLFARYAERFGGGG